MSNHQINTFSGQHALNNPTCSNQQMIGSSIDQLINVSLFNDVENPAVNYGFDQWGGYPMDEVMEEVGKCFCNLLTLLYFLFAYLALIRCIFIFFPFLLFFSDTSFHLLTFVSSIQCKIRYMFMMPFVLSDLQSS